MSYDAGGLTGDEERDLRGGTCDGERKVYGVKGSLCPLGGELGLETAEGGLLPTDFTRAGVELSAGTGEEVGGVGS